MIKYNVFFIKILITHSIYIIDFIVSLNFGFQDYGQIVGFCPYDFIMN